MEHSAEGFRRLQGVLRGVGKDSVMDPYAYQAVWGEGVELLGPRHYYRETLILRKLAKYLKGGRVLDAGSGCGTLAIRLAETGFEVASVEATDDALAHVLSKVDAARFTDRCSFQKGDITSLSFPDDDFDAAVAGEILEHYKDDKLVTDELSRMVKPGGFAVVSVPAFKGLWGIDDELAGHFRRYDKKDLQVLFEQSGFRAVEITCWGFPVTRSFRRLVLYPYIKRRMKGSPGPPGIRPVLGWMAARIGPPASLLFQIDGLFNWTNLGIGLIGVFRRE